MNIATKRAIAAVSILVLCAGLQWVSGIPFRRAPDEAFFCLVAIMFAGLAAIYPGFDE